MRNLPDLNITPKRRDDRTNLDFAIAATRGCVRAADGVKKCAGRARVGHCDKKLQRIHEDRPEEEQLEEKKRERERERERLRERNRGSKSNTDRGWRKRRCRRKGERL